jgi:hypothetical protein
LLFAAKSATISQMNELKRPLIPQFSLRWILALTAVLSVVSFIISQALRGRPWAAGVTVAFAALVVAFLVYAALFAVAWLTAEIASRRRLRHENRRSASGERSEPGSAKVTTTAVLLLAIGLSTIGGGPTLAATGGAVTLPILAPKQTNKTGLTITVDTSWVDVCGYRPVQVELNSIAGALTADRELTIELWVGHSRSSGIGMLISQVITVPEGSKSAKAVIAVPQSSPWSMCEWTVYEDGEKVDQLSADWRVFSGSFGGNSYFGDGGPPSILALDGAGQLSVNHMTVLGQTDSSVMFVGGTRAATPLGPTFGLPGGSMLGPGMPSLSDLPTRWIDYSGIDLIITSLMQLVTLAEKHPAQWRAIQLWVKAGGNLIVYGVGEKWKDGEKNQLPQLEALLDFAPSLPPQSGASELVKRGWVTPQRELRDMPLSGVGTGIGGTPVVDPAAAEATKTSTPSTFVNPPFVVRPYGNGMVAAIRSNDNFTGTQQFLWPWLYNTLGPDRWQWYQRYGVSMTQSNSDFWNFMIPGVGAAPVTAFQVLITLFVLAIGPLNYYLLRRIGKLNLLIISVPLCAAIITGTLFLYAVVADGLGVRLRARSVTHIDQRTGDATCWARLSYYAGLSPSGGLSFSDETAVIPLEFNPTLSEMGGMRELDWLRTERNKPDSPHDQRLATGWLDARTLTQFMTVRARKSTAKLTILPPESATPPRVKNELGAAIHSLILIDDESRCFTTKKLDSGETTELEPAASQVAAAAALIDPLFRNNEPRLEVEAALGGNHLFRRHYYDNVGYRSGRYIRGGYNNQNNANAPQQATGVLERTLRQVREQLNSNTLPPRTYIAIVEMSPEMELGTRSANEESSLHVVIGRW